MGHRGLLSAKLFTDLDKIEEGDTFTIDVLGQTLTYQVYHICIIEPDDLSNLTIEEGRDLCTLVTCTPYGINTHRLLVQGERLETTSKLRISSDALVFDPVTVTFVVLFPVLMLIFFIMMLPKKNHQKQKK